MNDPRIHDCDCPCRRWAIKEVAHLERINAIENEAKREWTEKATMLEAENERLHQRMYSSQPYYYDEWLRAKTEIERLRAVIEEFVRTDKAIPPSNRPGAYQKTRMLARKALRGGDDE